MTQLEHQTKLLPHPSVLIEIIGLLNHLINSWCTLYTIQPILAVCTFQPHNKASTRTIRKEPWQKADSTSSKKG